MSDFYYTQLSPFPAIASAQDIAIPSTSNDHRGSSPGSKVMSKLSEIQLIKAGGGYVYVHHVQYPQLH